ncbi:Holliday junction resolvase RuvX [Neisseria sp. 83E34]|uniref:Holliday junction resolvase RuvX n=1 Tax=Neisseria sp. 83E34 TaxID=1692264 RepID=UPI0006CE7791|nr:Holliday junction resolvase RuvX [Neisseria sp. 83E34]KPN71718.1 Holliday junction resolvase [Neisseria sp. 83E34]
MPEAIKVPRGTVLAFDFGEVRIGVAQGDAEIGLAHPLATVTGESNEAKFAAIDKLVKEWQPHYFAVGLPTHTDGAEHELTRLSRKFGRRLHGRYKLPVYWVDERLSSVYAEGLLAEAQVFGRKQKSVLDQVAAQAILHSLFESGAVEWFDGNNNGDTMPV